MSRPLRYAVATILGVVACAVNRLTVPLLTEETPEFVFGGALVLFAFIWLGRGPGFLAGGLSLALILTRGDPAGFATLVYILEAWAICALGRRTRSLVVAAAVFWLGVGWAWDLAVYGGLVGLDFPYVALLFVKQLFNAILNALVVELVLLLPPLARHLAPDAVVDLHGYVLRRILLVVTLPALVLALLFTCASYAHHRDRARSRDLQTAGEISTAVHRFLDARAEVLERFARQLEIRLSNGEAVDRAQIEAVQSRLPEPYALGLTDARGMIQVASPASNARDAPLVGQTILHLSCFHEARLLEQTAYSALVGANHPLRTEAGNQLLVMLAEPLFDSEGTFLGVLFTTLDSAELGPLLQTAQRSPEQVAMVFDSEHRIVASFDPTLPPGTLLTSRFPAASLQQSASTTFSYFPPPHHSPASRLALDLRYATRQDLFLRGWGVLVDLPAASLHRDMLTSIPLVLGFVGATLGLLYLTVWFLARRLARPLAMVEQAARAMAPVNLAHGVSFTALAASPILEIRSLAAAFKRMHLYLKDDYQLTQAHQEESRERLRATFDHAVMGIGHLSPTGQVLRVNKRFCAILGNGEDELVGCDSEELTHADDREAERVAMARILAGERKSTTQEKRFVRRDGEWVWTHTTLSLVRDANGQAKYFICVVEDITERRQLEEQLRQAQKMESIGRLAGGVAHDFNNLLTAIIGYAQLVQMRLPAEGQAQREVGEILRASERATRLTQQLLTFARRQAFEPTVLDLTELLRGMEDMLRRLIGEHIELEIRHTTRLGRVRADAGQLEQVIVNLAVNARDAMPEGGKLTIETANQTVDERRVRSRPTLTPGPHVTLSVRDNGHGMSEAVRAQIFEPFFTTKDKDKGTGLGLATSYGIITGSDGHIEAESERGVGTCFRIFLPRVDAAASALREESSGHIPRGRETVLVAEDEPPVAALVSRILRRQGYTVLQAEDGLAALALSGQHEQPIDLLLTDLVMPRMGGRELAAAVRETRPDLKVLFTSGYMEEASAVGGQGDARVAFLPKPFTPDQLAQAVHEVLHSS